MTPGRAIPAVLEGLRGEAGFANAAAYALLWRHAAGFLLGRSARPPVPPADWVVDTAVDCSCELCAKLRSFCADPDRRVERFSVRKELRRHLHGIIDRHGLDMSHETERRGSPYTLVCTKNRASHERRLEEYAEDIARMRSLLESAPGGEPGRTCLTSVARLQRAVAEGTV